MFLLLALISNMKVILFCLCVSLYLHCNKGMIYRTENVFVPAIIAFGDFLLDSGNNNHINVVFKANFPPYGQDFMGGKPTGRFSNGKTLADFFANALGVKEYLPAYLDPLIEEKDLLTGISFASAGSGYDPLTPIITSSIPLLVQLDMFKEYLQKLERNIGGEATMNIITNSVFIISASGNDFLMNYYNVPVRRLQYDVPAYANMLVKLAISFIQEIHKLGARRIVVFSTPPIGSIPIARTLAGGAHRMYVEEYNKAAGLFNTMLKQQLQILASGLPQSRVVFPDFYTPQLALIQNAHQYGFEVTDRGCCGTGEVETGFMCNKLSQTCQNHSKFLFWDSIHPTEKGNDIFIHLVLPEVLKSLF